jgi:hypothetical protein
MSSGITMLKYMARAAKTCPRRNYLDFGRLIYFRAFLSFGLLSVRRSMFTRRESGKGVR